MGIVLLLLFKIILSNNVINIVHINDTNYKEIFSNKSKPWFIFLGSKTCPYCIKFLSTFKKLSDYYSEVISFGSVNCYNNKVICKKFKAKEYPTLYLLLENKVFQFEGNRSIDNLITFLTKDYINSKKYNFNWETIEVIDDYIKRETSLFYILKVSLLLHNKYIFFIVSYIITNIILVKYYLFCGSGLKEKAN